MKSYRLLFVLFLMMVPFATGCRACVDAAGIEVISEEEMQPLPASPVGPRGMPTWTALGDVKLRTAANLMACTQDDPAEHDHASYDEGERGHGSARRLRGKVAIIDLRIASAAGEPWTPIALRHADEEAAEARAFLLREAARHGVADLSLDVLPWFVTTRLPEVNVDIDRLGRPSWAAVSSLREQVLGQVSASTGVSLHAAVGSLRKRGYQEVAIMVRLPTSHLGREFASWASGDLDVAFVQLQTMGTMPGAYAHELLHLFGADDLYRLNTRDPRDVDDVMGGSCGGVFDRAHVADATAWAIGWRAQPPPRAYPIAGRTRTAARAPTSDSTFE